MKNVVVLAAVSVSLLMAGRASADYCVNKDIINLGPTAYDLAVLINPPQPVTFHYDGWAGALFGTFTVAPSGPDQMLHWQNLNGVNDPIPTGTATGPLFHIGWCTGSPNNVTNMYWTDLSGNPIPGGVVYQVSGHASSSSTPGVQWDNATNHSFTVNNVYYSPVPTPFPLGDLNGRNTNLTKLLKPLPGGKAIPIDPRKSAQLSLPGVNPGDWLVVVYEVTGEGTRGIVKDFVQFQMPRVSTAAK
jgi:hypothetical protein